MCFLEVHIVICQFIQIAHNHKNVKTVLNESKIEMDLMTRNMEIHGSHQFYQPVALKPKLPPYSNRRSKNH